MNYLPHQPHFQRPTRVRLPEFTPAVLRIGDGSCTSGELHLISLTGGLLSLPHPLNHGSRVKLMFLTQTGPVLGTAEMLRPVSWSEQPFRFVALHENDQRRLRAVIQPWMHASAASIDSKPTKPSHFAATPGSAPTLDGEEQWIDKYRAAIARSNAPRWHFLKMFFGAATAAALALGTMYAVHVLR